MVIWKDIDVRIRHKTVHVRKVGGRLYNSFINDYGDIPAIHYNEITKLFEPVVNLRGRAYAARKRQSYRLKRREQI